MTETRILKWRCAKAPTWHVGVLIALMFVAASQAQRTTRVEIRLLPCDAKEPTKVSFVLNGEPKTELDHTLNHWIFSLPEEDEFVIQDACGSLRLGGARTNCQRPVPVKDPEHRYAPRAQFTFTCDEQDAWPVVIRTVPPIVVSYVRRLESSKTQSTPRDCPCREPGWFDDGKRTLPDVRFPVEKVLLQLGVEPPDDKALSLNVSAIKRNKTSDFLSLLSGQITGPSRKILESKVNQAREEYDFSMSGVAGLLSIQRARGNSSAPTLSSTAIDIDTAKLKKMPLTKLTLTVN